MHCNATTKPTSAAATSTGTTTPPTTPKAELLTDGYFNASVDALRVGDIIEAMVDADGTPAFARTRVTAATAGSDVTVVELL